MVIASTNQLKGGFLEGYLKLTEAAERLGVSYKTMYRWVTDEEHDRFPNVIKMDPYSKTSPYLIPVSDIEAFEAKRKGSAR